MKYEHKSILGGIPRPINSPIENAFSPPTSLSREIY